MEQACVPRTLIGNLLKQLSEFIVTMTLSGAEGLGAAKGGRVSQD
jgi:hypothetical protein